MKFRCVTVVLVIAVLLLGCGSTASGMDRAMALRSRLVSADGYSFDTEITADFGEKTYTFVMNCQTDSQGNVAFTVSAPDTIAGITGKLNTQGGELTFDHTSLAFELLADGQFSPVSAPWLLVHTLHYGYLTSCAELEGGLLLCADDSYEDDPLNLDIYLGDEDLPTGAEVSWNGQRILSMTVKNFIFQ